MVVNARQCLDSNVASKSVVCALSGGAVAVTAAVVATASVAVCAVVVCAAAAAAAAAAVAAAAAAANTVPFQSLQITVFVHSDAVSMTTKQQFCSIGKAHVINPPTLRLGQCLQVIKIKLMKTIATQTPPLTTTQTTSNDFIVWSIVVHAQHSTNAVFAARSGVVGLVPTRGSGLGCVCSAGHFSSP